MGDGRTPITGELRMWWRLHMEHATDADLNEGLANLCDAIDAVHAGLEEELHVMGEDLGRAVRERDAMAAALDRLQGERDEGQWVRLPVDADGVPIRVGDRLTDGEYTFAVHELAMFADGSWSIRNEDGNAWAACDVTHHHAATVKDVLREMLSTWDSPDNDMDSRELIAEYAKRLRLAGDAE